ncbi:MAG: FAD-dependent oxidoreductase [Chromatiales bacterium]|jgi:L-2-hydroxyglutarate oxidase LhgO|nr:FAD-dependent oxidoreductase [Chromatiales bacterium]
MAVVDCVVVGAGAAGLACARALALRGQHVLVAEAAGAVGTGASSRNSGVIHAGLYYPAASLKARLCVEGRRLLYEYLAARGIAHRRTGKFIVAASPDEIPVLEQYLATGQASGVEGLQWFMPPAMARLEPAVHCILALYSPETGIFDTHGYLLALQADLEAAGGSVALHSAVVRVTRAGNEMEVWLAGADAPAVRARRVVNAAGLGAVALARSVEGLDPALVPTAYFARGRYYALGGPAPFTRLIYPVAGPAGLGIHVTLDLAGQVRFGPDVEWIDGVDYAFDDGARDAFVAAIRRYYPGLDPARLRPAHAGIRAKIAGPGEPAADFRIDGPGHHGIPGLVNLFAIESPGLTASLALGHLVADLVT